MTPRPGTLLRLLALSAGVGLLVSLAAWGFLEVVHQVQQLVITTLPGDLGYDHGAPWWWWVGLLALAGLLTAAAIAGLPGEGGHIPAHGLSPAPTTPVAVPGVLLAGLASIGLGAVVGPEAPLIAMGGGLGALAIRLANRDAPAEAQTVMAAAGSFAALSMIFESPVIAAVILIEATGIGGSRLPLVLLPGLLAAGIGSLVSTGMGAWTGLSTSAYALGQLPLPQFARPDATDFLWAVALAVAVALGVWVVLGIGRAVVPIVQRRLFIALPVAGVVVAGLAVAFDQATDKGVPDVLFSGQDALTSLVAQHPAWSLSALALVIVFKGLAWGISLGSFRGGPTFPALFLGAAAGLLAAHLPGFDVTPAVAVGMAASVVAVLRLPLSAVVVAELLTAGSGAGSAPLIIVAVVVAYLVTVALPPRPEPGGGEQAGTPEPDRSPAPVAVGSG
jgi:H+/Cl- antiporter ClcA